MLKIKDNIDLKELEKYHFTNKYSKKGNYEKTIDYAYTIWVDATTKEIYIEQSMNIIDDDKSVSMEIQDLIQAGLVEKVVE
jgi:uncharacterized membrane protein YfhO